MEAETDGVVRRVASIDERDYGPAIASGDQVHPAITVEIDDTQALAISTDGEAAFVCRHGAEGAITSTSQELAEAAIGATGLGLRAVGVVK